jgi:CDP-diacylglycerol--glycerol-3-phosphate 3-phosphatidyltransferase
MPYHTRVKFGPTTLPTQITLGRLVVSPVFVLCFWLGVVDPRAALPELEAAARPGWLIVALVILLLQEASDVVDGELARRRGVVSDLGKLLDPLADTMSHMGGFLCLMWVDLVPLWLLVLMYYREAMVGMLRTLAARHGRVLGARLTGKLKAICQGASVNLLLILLIVAHYVPGFPLREVADVLTCVLAAVTVGSLIDYAHAAKRM